MLLKGVNAAPSKMKVRITNLDGRDILVDLQREWTVDKVKIIAIDHFFRASESMKLSLYHKLLHVRLCKTLKEECTLLQEGVKDNDEILLLKRRLPPSTFESAEKQREDRRAPDLSTIRRMTAHLQKVTYSSKAEEPVHSVHFQTELRRILITLIEASQRILCLNPAAAEIFKQAEERLNEPAPKKRVDQVALRQLADMGFPEARARKALILNKMSVVAAMEWLFQNETDPDIDDPLPELEMCAIQDTSSLGAEGGLETNVAVSNSNQPPFRNILDSIRAFRKREFRPNHRALQRLIEMGFKENEAVDALLMFRNDQDAACDWLLGERKEQVLTVEEGLEPDSLIYQAIMDNPVVQLGLNNPRCLLAFLQMLENPLLANQWLSDPETGPILMQVSRIYQMRLDIEGIASSTSSNEVASTSSTSTFVSTSLPSTLFTTTSVSTLSISPSNPTTTLEPALSVSPSNPTTTSVSTLSLSPSTVPSETVPASPTVLLMPTTLSTSTSDPSHTSSSKPFFSSGTR